MTPVVELIDIKKIYGVDESEVRAVDGVTLSIARGEFVAVMGASGSGKSTLMNIIGALDVATSGTYLLDGIDIGELDDDALSLVRNRRIGFIFQSFNLIPRMSAVANVELPLMYRGVSRSERREKATQALASVGLSDRMHHQPNQLSGGQQQRVAVARALAMEPALMLADEPTGNLDSRSTAEVLDLLESIHARGGTIAVITHEDEVAARAQRVITLRDGKIESDSAVINS